MTFQSLDTLLRSARLIVVYIMGAIYGEQFAIIATSLVDAFRECIFATGSRK